MNKISVLVNNPKLLKVKKKKKHKNWNAKT